MNVNGPHFTGGSHAGSGKERGTVLIRDGRKALPGAECGVLMLEYHSV